MSDGGTAAYANEVGLPGLVVRALELAQKQGFAFSCRPEQGRLLAALARGRDGGLIGETGSGCGVGLAWMVDAASPDTRFVSIDVDSARAEACRRLFGDHPNVTVLLGDWRELSTFGPFDMLVLDGGGHGKGGHEAVDPRYWLKPMGSLIVDDFAPAATWPPEFAGHVDGDRLHWLEHPSLRSTELRLGADLATIVGLHVR